MTGIKTVFLDRDGVINCKRPDYVKCWREFEFLPGAREALQILRRAGYCVIVVTNQRGVAQGAMSERDLHEIHEKMFAELERVGAKIDAIYYCPHDFDQCTCRKPKTGLFWNAKHDFPGIDFPKSVMIGDALADMEAGSQLGCQTLLIADPSGKDRMVKDVQARGIAINGIAPSLFDGVVQYLLPMSCSQLTVENLQS